MRSLTVALVAALAVSLGLVAGPASATNIGNEGCTPGYWKNHTENWQETSPTALMSSLYTAAGKTSLATVTNEEALRLHGGRGVQGAEHILARAAVAAWLDSAHEGLGYPSRRWSTGLDGRPALVPAVNDALRSGDRDTMLSLAERLDADNNLGCPLS